MLLEVQLYKPNLYLYKKTLAEKRINRFRHSLGNYAVIVVFIEFSLKEAMGDMQACIGVILN